MNTVEKSLEIARVGFICSFPELEIYVCTDDEFIEPHFHIRDKDTRGKKFHSCISIIENSYFYHHFVNDELNLEQRKELNDFFKKQHKSFNVTEWEMLIYEWNKNNLETEVPDDLKQPDYTTIEDNK